MATEGPYVLIGAGGHAKAVLEAILASGGSAPGVILDNDPGKRALLGHAVRGGDEHLGQLAREGITHFAVGIGGARDNGPRRRAFEAARGLGLEPVRVVHPAAFIAPSATVVTGAHVLPRAVVHSDARVGPNAIVNTGAIVEHDCSVGAHAHVASGAVLASTVEVGEGAHVGAGAVVRQGLRIGAGAIIGAGAVVVADVSPGALVVGVPAKERER